MRISVTLAKRRLGIKRLRALVKTDLTCRPLLRVFLSQYRLEKLAAKKARLSA